MLTLRHRQWLGCFSVACCAWAMNTAQAADIPGATYKNWSATCSNGNFTGEVRGRYYYLPHGVAGAMVESYRITKRNGQQGGNKANINILIGEGRYMQNHSGWAKSPDRMVQNGQWQGLDLKRNGYLKDMHLTYEFVFDKSGADPKCSSNIRLG